MKCSNCGAEIGNNKTCDFCGSQITLEMQKEQEQMHKVGCPKCYSTNIQFKRENQGEIRGKKSKYVVHKTVGFCKDCGYTWIPAGSGQQKTKKNRLWLWVLGWICIFPVPLTILMLRKKEMKSSVKYGIIAFAWIIYFLIMIIGNTSAKLENKNADLSTHEVVESSTSTNITSVISEETTDESLNLDSIIENAVNDYNLIATDKLIFVEDFIPSDKNGSHYRTEFRLGVYIDAIGKSYSMNGNTIDFVINDTLSREYDIRLYSYGITADECKSLISGFSSLFDPEMKASELNDTLRYIEENKSVNGYYYGNLCLTMLGSDENGYELMIKTN